MNLINIAYLSLALSTIFLLSRMGGWVVGWVGEIKIKDHLSPAKAEIRAELGNIQFYS